MPAVGEKPCMLAVSGRGSEETQSKAAVAAWRFRAVFIFWLHDEFDFFMIFAVVWPLVVTVGLCPPSACLPELLFSADALCCVSSCVLFTRFHR